MFEITLLLELSALIVGLLFIRTIFPRTYVPIIGILFLSVLNESLSHYGFYNAIGLPKPIAYNSFFLIEFLIISFIYLKEFINLDLPAKRTLLIVFVPVFIGLLILFSIRGLSSYDPDSISIMSGWLIVIPIIYLIEIYNREKIFNFKYSSIFWFSVGLIVVQFFLLLYINARRIDSFVADKNRIEIFKVLNTIGNLIYYSCLIYSFICTSLSRRQAII